MRRHEFSALDKAIKHYESLFTVPSHSLALFLLLLVTIFLGSTVFLLITPTVIGIYSGIIFGLSGLALPSIGLDLTVRGLIMCRDRLFTLRRCTVTTLSGCLIWVVVFVIGAVLSFLFRQPSLGLHAYFYGGCIALSIRYLIFRALSSLSHLRVLVASVSQPVICSLTSYAILQPKAEILLSSALAGTFLLILTYLFIESIDRYGDRIVGIGAVQLLRAFVLDWAENLPYSLERHFEKIGREENISLAVLAFKCEGRLHAYLVVPALHPGPFRDVGSSKLPFLVQKALEDRFNVVTAVPHGTSGHELDLTSQEECRKVVDEILSLSHLQIFSPKATRLVRVENSLAKATCQMFNGCALVTVTCSPREIEDISRNVGFQIVSDGVRMGAETAVVVDAHNSIASTTQLPSFTDADAASIREAASEAISRALQEPYEDFTIGVAKVVPTEFDLKQGMGPGGIVSLVVKVGKQMVAYVTIDGNNMIVNLRDKILGSLYTIGIDEGEVMTTDTHMVNAVTLTRRGYHPIGEAMDQERLVNYINQATLQAVNDVKPGEVAFRVGMVPRVRVIGDGVIRLSLFVDSVVRHTKRLAVVTVILGIATSLLVFKLFV
jgi:putative membrane protein